MLVDDKIFENYKPLHKIRMQKETKLTFYYKYRGDGNFLLRQTKN